MLRSRAPRRRSNKSFRPTTLKLGGAGVRCPIFSGPHLKLSISCPCRFVFLKYFTLCPDVSYVQQFCHGAEPGDRGLCVGVCVCVAQSHSSNRLFVLMLSGRISSAPDVCVLLIATPRPPFGVRGSTYLGPESRPPWGPKN